MKLKNKLILIFILFTFFVIFNNSNCFATSYTSLKGETMNFPEFNNLYTDTNDIAFIVKVSNSYYYLVLTHRGTTPNDSISRPYIHNKYRLMVSPGFSSYYVPQYSKLYLLNNNSWVLNRDCSSYVNGLSQDITDIFFSNTDIYDLSNQLVISKSIETTKHDLFELNLTDKNLNDSLHTFKLNTDENSVNYNELSSLIENNKKYCIYITDYTRLLCWHDNSFYSNLDSGAYLLSGYIDFLVSDHAYFYFSPHYNRIKVCSGDYRGHDMTTFTKRFFFTLVASEDSDDTYFTIFDDNGILWALSDYVNDGDYSQTDEITDIKNSYFVGSNQKIYYANEDNNYILDSLTDSIYYGKNRGEDDRVYNFAFSGGNTKEFFLNNATFDNDVDSQNEELEEKHDTVNPNYIPDSSGGKSSILPQDETSYTYPPDTVDDNTNQEDDESNVQPERLPYTSDDSTDDSSNWSIWDFLKGIFEKIGDLLSTIVEFFSNLVGFFIRLFVPSSDFFSNLFTDIDDWFELKLGFIFYPFEFFMDLFNRITNIEFAEPIISIPNINEPFSNEILIHAVDFNFNDLLENESIEIAHNYYLMFVDVILIIGFINLLKTKFEEVTRK